LWGHSGDNGNAFIGLSPDGDNGDGTFGSWTRLYSKKIMTGADHNAMQIDPVRDIIVVVVSASNALFAIDPSDPGREIARLSSEGDPPVISEYAALEYAPNLDRFVYYSANDGPQIYSIASPAGSTWPQLVAGAWTWRSLLNEGNRLDPVHKRRALILRSEFESHLRTIRVATPVRPTSRFWFDIRTRRSMP
jgi:hypothetical protein